MRYLNHAGTSYPKPETVAAAAQEFFAAPPEQYSALYGAAWTRISEEFAQVPGRLLLTSGCTASLCLAFQDLAIDEGARVVTSSVEHHALSKQLDVLSEGLGVRVEVTPYLQGEAFDRNAFLASLREPVALVALSAASNITGERLPLRWIGQELRSRGIPLLVDAAQTFGTDLFGDSLEVADIVVAAGHKSALGPHGIGLLWGREGAPFVSRGAVCEVGEAPCLGFPGFCDAGSVNLLGAMGLAAGLSWEPESGRASAWEAARARAARVRRSLQEHRSWRLLGGTEADANAVVSFVPSSPDVELALLQDLFLARGLLLRVGTHCAADALAALGVESCVRASFGPMTTDADADALIDALDGVIAAAVRE